MRRYPNEQVTKMGRQRAHSLCGTVGTLTFRHISTITGYNSISSSS